jgi:hypothetical protein
VENLEIRHSLGSISSWLVDHVQKLEFGILQVDVVVKKGRVFAVDKMVKEQIRVEE